MPSFLPPDAVRFELRDGAPVIVLDVETPPELAAGEWTLLNRLTLGVVDGSGDAGFLLAHVATGSDPAPAGWDDAVDRTAGSHVVFGLGADAPTVFARRLN